MLPFEDLFLSVLLVVGDKVFYNLKNLMDLNRHESTSK